MNLSKKSTGIKIALLAVAFIFTVILGGCNLVQKNPEAAKKEAVAKIGEDKFTKQEFNYYFTLTKLNGKLQGQEIPSDEEQLKQIKGQVLDNVVQDRLMVKIAKEEDIKVDEKEAEKQVEEWNKMLQGDLEGEEEYKKFLEENEITTEEFDGFLKELGLANQYITGLFEKITKDVKATDEDVVKYYQENVKQFDPSTVKAKHILVTKDKKDLAEEIKKKAQEGKDFDKLMEEYKGKEGVQEAADLGEFEYTKMVPEFSKAAFALEPGKVSDLVETEYGFHVIKLVKKNEKPVQKLEEVREAIKEQLQQTVQYEAYDKYINEKKEEIKVETFPEKL